MQLIRTLSILKYSNLSKRFQSDTFREYKGSISVFDSVCAVAVSGAICKHIDRFYASTVKNPPLYCILDSDILVKQPGFENISITSSLSSNGDKCHIDIQKTKTKDCDNFAKRTFKFPNILKCTDSTYSIATEEELDAFYTQFIDSLS